MELVISFLAFLDLNDLWDHSTPGRLLLLCSWLWTS